MNTTGITVAHCPTCGQSADMISVRIYLDGGTKLTRPRPADWHEITQAARDEFIDAMKREVLGDSVVFDIEGHACDDLDCDDFDARGYTGPYELPPPDPDEYTPVQPS